MMADNALRDHVVWLLDSPDAHLTFERAVQGIPEDMRGSTPAGVPHSPWRLVEHMRICQWDILEFTRNPQHVSPEFPGGLWPEGDGPPHEQAWNQSIAAFLTDRQEMADLVADGRNDLFAPIPHGTGQSILREALLLADHNAYHLGQLVTLRRVLGIWPDER